MTISSFFLVWFYFSGALTAWLLWDQKGNRQKESLNPTIVFVVVAVLWFITIPVTYLSAMIKNRDD